MGRALSSSEHSSLAAFRVNLRKRLATRGCVSVVAKRAGMTRGNLSYIVNGDRSPSLAAALRIADALGVSLDSMLRESADIWIKRSKKSPRRTVN